MKFFKKVLNKIIFPPLILAVIVFFLSLLLLLYASLTKEVDDVLSIISYVLSFYGLTIVCLKIPEIIKLVKKIKNENKLIVKFRENINFRINITLLVSLVLNISYSIFQLCLGIYHKSLWFYSMAFYYILLTVLRAYLVSHTRNYSPGEDLFKEYKKYNFCGWIMLVINLAVSTIIIYITQYGRTFYHHQITTITLAAYTFLTFSFSIYNFIKYRKYNSPVYSAAKSINLVCACVSMMTLTSTMLTTFGSEDDLLFKKILLTAVGAVVSLFILLISIQIIVFSNKNIKKLSKQEELGE